MKDAIEKIKVNTRKYAKRQITWLKRDSEYLMISSSKKENRISEILNYLNKKEVKLIR